MDCLFHSDVVMTHPIPVGGLERYGIERWADGRIDLRGEVSARTPIAV